MEARGRGTAGKRAFAERQFRLGEAIRGDHEDTGRTELGAELRQFSARAIGDFLAAEQDRGDALEPELFFHGLREHMVEKRRHAREDVRTDFLDRAQVALRAHDLAAASRQAENIPVESGVMHIPKRQMRGEGKHVQHPVVARLLAEFGDAAGADAKVRDVMLRVEKRHRLGRAAGRRRHEGRAPLAIEFVLHAGFAAEQSAQDCCGPPRELRGVGLQDEIKRAPRIFLRRQQILFARERDLLQIIHRPDVVRGQARLAKNPFVVGGERQHAIAQVGVQLAALQFADGGAVQAMPFLGQLGVRHGIESGAESAVLTPRVREKLKRVNETGRED